MLSYIKALNKLKKLLAPCAIGKGVVTTKSNHGADDVWIVTTKLDYEDPPIRFMQTEKEPAGRFFVNFPIPERDRLYAGATLGQMRMANYHADLKAAEILFNAGLVCWNAVSAFQSLHNGPIFGIVPGGLYIEGFEE